ncbi:MAG: DNA-directed DNA polymerase [Candidatus Pacearchaeota archaeon]
MKTNFIPIDYDNFDYEGKNYALITGRNSDGRRVCVVDSCKIYFWAILKDRLSKKKIDKLVEKIKRIKIISKGRETRVEKVEVLDKKFLDKKVKALKIYATNYKDLHDIADRLGVEEIQKRRGYDLGFITHYIIESGLSPMNWYEIEGEVLHNSKDFGGIDTNFDVDLFIKLNSSKKIDSEKKFKPKALCYDIECDELKIGEGNILMISLVSDNFKKVITWKKNKNTKVPNYVELVKDEKELIEKFISYIKEISPDFLVGYFSDGFDLPYLKARADKHKIKLSLNLDNSIPRISKGGFGFNLTTRTKGLVHIDILKFIRTAYSQYMKSETLSLNEVSKEFLNDKKKKFELKHMISSDHDKWEEYYEYNLHDSILVMGLFEKFFQDIIEFSKVIREPIHEITRAGLSRYVEAYILHRLNEFNEIPEKKPTHDEIGSRRGSGGVEGAFVYEPKPGLYKKIAMFDFTSMHTSIIISHNLSKGTLLDKKEKEAYESPEVELKGKKNKFYFAKEPGFFPQLLNEIFLARKKYKAEYKKNSNVITLARSNSYKVLSASVHGYVGFFGARYYSIESSASILGFVRKYNKDTIKNIEKLGLSVIYGDTDSIAFLMGNKKEKEIKEILEKLNSKLPGIMELELEDFYERGLWVTTRDGKIGAKKKYALINKKNELKIRGFETVRRDWCPLSRKVQDKVLRLILEEGNEKNAIDYVKKVIKKIKKHEIDKKELIIKTQLKKPLSEYKSISPHVVAARKMKELEIPITEGNLIEYFIAESKDKKKTLVRDRVKLLSEEGNYDVKYYLENQILPAVENIFQVFKIDIRTIVEGKNQMTLGDFK